MYAEATKVCGGKKGCGLELPRSAFHKNASNNDGLETYCKDCKRRIYREWRARSPGYRLRRSALERIRRYGLTNEEVQLFTEVPVCQSCGLPFDSPTAQKFDHCHELGHVRGVICHVCNLACAGTSEVALSRLQLCVEYLRRDIEREQARAS
jgi:hypothetical protein